MSKITQVAVILFFAEVLHRSGKFTADGSFLCSSVGFFKDETSCTRFYRCLKVNKPAVLFSCPPDSPVFNATTELCVSPVNRGNSSDLCPSQSSTVSTSRSWGVSAFSSPVSVVRSTPTLRQSDITVAVTSSAIASRTRNNVPSYTTTRTSTSGATQTAVNTTTGPATTPLDWRDCRSKAFDEMLTCFKTEARKVKERLRTNVSVNITRRILQTTADYADDVLDALASRKDSADDFNAFDIIATLEDIWKGALRHMPNSTEKIRIFTKSIVVESVDVDGQYKFPDYSLEIFKKRPWNQTSDTVFLPKKLLSDDKYPCRSVSALYLNLHSVVPSRTLGINSSLKINSHVISSLLCVPVKKSARGQVTIVMKHLKVLDENEYTFCAFWDFAISTAGGKGVWSLKGCHVVSEKSNTTHTVCSCNHLTNFAILMGSTELSVSEANQFALSIITYIGCVLSLFGAVGAITSFVVFTNLNTDRHIIHSNLLIAIAISQTIFLAGIEQTRNEMQCKFTAIMLHYFYLVSFGWMLCEGLHLYTMVVKVFNISSKIYHYVVFAWGVPALIVLITAVCRYSDYGTDTSCWISPERNTLLAFIIPVAVTIFANIVILAMVLNEICRLQTSGRSCVGEVAMSTIKSLGVLFPLLGVTWLFGLLLFATHYILFQYLFAIFNTLQGFFIFLLHCLFNSEIRKNFKRKKEAWKSMKAFRYLRKRISASSTAPSPPHSSLSSEKAATFKASSR